MQILTLFLTTTLMTITKSQWIDYEFYPIYFLNNITAINSAFSVPKKSEMNSSMPLKTDTFHPLWMLSFLHFIQDFIKNSNQYMRKEKYPTEGIKLEINSTNPEIKNLSNDVWNKSIIGSIKNGTGNTQSYQLEENPTNDTMLEMNSPNITIKDLFRTIRNKSITDANKDVEIIDSNKQNENLRDDKILEMNSSIPRFKNQFNGIWNKSIIQSIQNFSRYNHPHKLTPQEENMKDDQNFDMDSSIKEMFNPVVKNSIIKVIKTFMNYTQF